MPIYEYKCDNCGRVFEMMQKFSDATLKECKFCSGRVSRLISQCTFHLKGSGWYVTDYSKSGSNGKKPTKREEPASEDSPKDSGPTKEANEKEKA